MRIDFRPLPGPAGDVLRPLVDVAVGGLEDASLACLLDTGSLHNRFAMWVAREAGIDLTGVEPLSVGVGGRPVIARTVAVSLTLGDYRWDAQVAFCEPWPWDFQLLGQEGFLRYFRVVIEAAEHRLEITPNADRG